MRRLVIGLAAATAAFSARAAPAKPNEIGVALDALQRLCVPAVKGGSLDALAKGEGATSRVFRLTGWGPGPRGHGPTWRPAGSKQTVVFSDKPGHCSVVVLRADYATAKAAFEERLQTAAFSAESAPALPTAPPSPLLAQRLGLVRPNPNAPPPVRRFVSPDGSLIAYAEGLTATRNGIVSEIGSLARFTVRLAAPPATEPR